MSFKDHFSAHAADYAKFRPEYPLELFEYLASLLRTRERAWDCATGNGQAARGLAKHFREVIATDASAEQLEKAAPIRNVSYRAASAEENGLPDKTIDLLTVAQALHWLDLELFFNEAKRVLRPGGVIAVWAYTLLKIAPKTDIVLDHFYYETIAPFWPPERLIVDDRYRGIEFPFAEMMPPKFHVEADWNLDQLLGYIRTWSATRRFTSARGFDPVSELEREILPEWGEREQKRVVLWPLHLRVGLHSE
jgi:SAM-dependent methyltransferase